MIWRATHNVETLCLSCTIFELQRVNFQTSPILTYNTCIWCPHSGWPDSNFAETFGIRKLQSLGYCVALFLWFYIQPFSHNTSMWQTDGETHDDSKYCTSTVSCGKTSQDRCIVSIKVEWEIIGNCTHSIKWLYCRWLWVTLNFPKPTEFLHWSIRFGTTNSPSNGCVRGHVTNSKFRDPQL